MSAVDNWRGVVLMHLSFTSPWGDPGHYGTTTGLWQIVSISVTEMCPLGTGSVFICGFTGPLG